MSNIRMNPNVVRMNPPPAPKALGVSSWGRLLFCLLHPPGRSLGVFAGAKIKPNNRKRIIFKELSYKIVSILFKVHNHLGGRYQEKYYQRAIEEELKNSGLKYEREILIDLVYNKKKIGKYLLDFLIDDKIVLEVKTVPKLKPEDFRQVLAYLKLKKLELGILVNFRGKKSCL